MKPRRATIPIWKWVNPEQAVVRAYRAYDRLLVAWERRVTLLPSLHELRYFSRVRGQVLTGCHTPALAEPSRHHLLTAITHLLGARQTPVEVGVDGLHELWRVERRS